MIDVAVLGVDVVEQCPAAVQQRAKLSGGCLLAFRRRCATSRSEPAANRTASSRPPLRQPTPTPINTPLWCAWVRSAIGIRPRSARRPQREPPPMPRRHTRRRSLNCLRAKPPACPSACSAPTQQESADQTDQSTPLRSEAPRRRGPEIPVTARGRPRLHARTGQSESGRRASRRGAGARARPARSTRGRSRTRREACGSRQTACPA